MSSGNRAELVRTIIRAGKNGRAFGSGMDRAIPGFIPGKGEKKDNWGPKFASCIGAAGQEYNRRHGCGMPLCDFFRLLALGRISMSWDSTFSDDHPAAGGTASGRCGLCLTHTALLSQHCLEDYHKEYSFCEEIPKDMHRVLRAAHEYDDGLAWWALGNHCHQEYCCLSVNPYSRPFVLK